MTKQYYQEVIDCNRNLTDHLRCPSNYGSYVKFTPSGCSFCRCWTNRYAKKISKSKYYRLLKKELDFIHNKDNDPK